MMVEEDNGYLSIPLSFIDGLLHRVGIRAMGLERICFATLLDPAQSSSTKYVVFDGKIDGSEVNTGAKIDVFFGVVPY